MPAPKSEEYWAMFAAKYVAYCDTTTNPAELMGRELGMPSRSVSTSVLRLKAKGLLENDSSIRRPKLTPRALAILQHVKDMEGVAIRFEVKVAAATKAEALAEVWDAVLQLENWDPKKGPFQYRPARMSKLGIEER